MKKPFLKAWKAEIHIEWLIFYFLYGLVSPVVVATRMNEAPRPDLVLFNLFFRPVLFSIAMSLIPTLCGFLFFPYEDGFKVVIRYFIVNAFLGWLFIFIMFFLLELYLLLSRQFG